MLLFVYFMTIDIKVLKPSSTQTKQPYHCAFIYQLVRDFFLSWSLNKIWHWLSETI